VCLVTADVDAPYQRPPPCEAVLAGGQPPEVTPILDDDAALGDVELLYTAADSVRCGHPDISVRRLASRGGRVPVSGRRSLHSGNRAGLGSV
jgi:hypothetical protein